MPELGVERFNEAVQACLKHCYEAPSPVPPLAEFLEGLRAESDWLEEEVRAVEVTVLRMLNSILTERGGAEGALGTASAEAE